jgi:hypothetical protein
MGIIIILQGSIGGIYLSSGSSTTVVVMLSD